jgi:Fic family protein
MQSALSDLEKFLNDDTRTMLPLMRAALSHAQFETIHPFVDGNGRTGRLMITFYLCSQQILERPVLYLSAYLKKHANFTFNFSMPITTTEMCWHG